MNRALLELLEDEKREIQNIKFCQESIDEFMKSCTSLASEYQKRLKESEKNLVEIRKEMKKIFFVSYSTIKIRGDRLK